MVGIVSAGLAGGQVVVPPLANQMIVNYGWRMSYFIMGIIALVVLVAAAQFLKRNPYQIGLLPDGAAKEKHDSLDVEPTGHSLLEAMHTKRFWMLTVVYFGVGFFAIATLLHIVPHATDLGIPAANAATIISTIGGMGIIGRIGMGNAADRIGINRALTIGFILTTAMLFWLPFIKGLGMLYVFAAVFGFAWGGTIAVQSPLLAESFGLKAHGSILRASAFSIALGCAVSPILTGYMFDVTGSYQSAFVVIAVLSLISLILTLLLKPTSSTSPLHFGS